MRTSDVDTLAIVREPRPTAPPKVPLMVKAPALFPVMRSVVFVNEKVERSSVSAAVAVVALIANVDRLPTSVVPPLSV